MDKGYIELSKEAIKDGEDGKILLSEYWLMRAVSVEDFGKMLDDFLNLGSKHTAGLAIGKQMATTHPTLQRLFVLFCLQGLVGIADREYTDDRNKYAIATAKKIKAMAEQGEFPVGGFI
jgi:hypothetical protein